MGFRQVAAIGFLGGAYAAIYWAVHLVHTDAWWQGGLLAFGATFITTVLCIIGTSIADDGSYKGSAGAGIGSIILLAAGLISVAGTIAGALFPESAPLIAAMASGALMLLGTFLGVIAMNM